jgi:DNA-binding transcriptional ArsR family regulator
VRTLDTAPARLYLTGQLVNQLVDYAMPPDHLSATFAALADPTRRAILARLALSETSVTELAEPFDMSLPAVSKHLKVLERAGLIARGREAQWRPCRIELRALKEVDDWLERYRRFWEQSFDRLDDYLRELQTKENKDGRESKTKRRDRTRR